MRHPPLPRRSSSGAPAAAIAALVVAAALFGAAGHAADPAPVAPSPLPFHRVFVPAGRLDDVPLGGHRLVPMPLEEFEEALRPSGVGADGAPDAALLPEARYRASLAPDGRILGTLEFDVAEGTAPLEVMLGALPVETGRAADAAGRLGVLLHGHRTRGVVASVRRAGTVTLPWATTPAAGDRYEVALVPAARSRFELALPADREPVAEGGRWVARPVEVAAADGAPATALTAPVLWRIDVGPLERMTLRVLPRRVTPHVLSCWQHAALGFGEVRIAARLVPTSPWRSRDLFVDADPRLVPEAVTLADTRDGTGADAVRAGNGNDRRLHVTLPEAAVGTTAAILVAARAPRRPPAAGEGDDWLPLVWPDATEWGGGGVRVTVEPGLSLVDFAVEEGAAVGEAVASSWPVPADGSAPAASVAVEAHAPGVRVRAAVLPATPDLDIARVTTVDVSAATVVGTARCDLRVRRGSAFDVSGRIGPGWFVDAVEAVETVDDEADGAGDVTVPIEWRVVRDDRGAELRIGLPTAATPRRGLTLRVSGHRAGVDAEVPFACREMDMVRLQGETDGDAVLVLASSPETTIELERDAPPPQRVPERVARLVSSDAVRAWIPADSTLLAGSGLLRERRAAVEGTTRVVLTCRDDRLTEAFTFVCRPGTTPLDAVVVHFSEPTDDVLEWALLPAADATLAVRRMSSPRERDSDGESWLVEFRPPLRRETGLRASRVVPFTGPAAVPLAWIEGDEREDGNLVVVNAGRRRPNVVNRRLLELPLSQPSGDVVTRGVVAEFGYTAADSLPRSPAAAEIVPGGRDRDEDARAWVWNEISTCWIHPTGVTEYETRYDVENHGRARVSLSVPEGLVPRGVTLDGVPVSTAADPRGGVLVVDLPADRRFVRVAVRAEAEVRTLQSGWRVPLVAAGIDTPVLERSWRVLVPDGVELIRPSAGVREVARAEAGWVDRLLGVGPRKTAGPADGSTPSRQGTIDAGFRERSFVLPAIPLVPPSVLLVHSTVLWGATLLVCLATAAFGLGVRRKLVRLGVAVGLAVLTQWVPPPFDAFARAGLWGLAAAAAMRVGARWWRTGATLAAAAYVCVAAITADAAPMPESLPVFIVPSAKGTEPEGGRTALVPEPLFRALAFAAGRRAGDGVRILAARLEARPLETGAWMLTVDVDADAGSLLSLEQDGDAVWGADGPLLDGAPVRPSADSGPRVLRVGFAAGGRHSVRVPLEVTPSRAGDVESARVSLPAAPHGTVVVDGSLAPAKGAPAPIQVDRPDARGLPRPVRADDRDGAPATFDVGPAPWVRLVWAADGRTALAEGAPAVESRNDIAWRDGGCRMAASFEVDGRGQIVRSVVVRADPRLGAMELSDPSLAATDLGGGRHLVVPPNPRRGRFAFTASFPIAIPDPVGTFDLPGAWLESAATDRRTVQIIPAGDLLLRATPPEDASTPTRSRGTADGEGAEWRVETGRGTRPPEADGAAAPAAILPGRTQPEGNGRIVVERRSVPPRASQRIDVELDRDRARVRLEARIDAVRTPLVVVPLSLPTGCVVERATLREERGAGPGAGAPESIDIRWHRAAPDRLLAVAQRPRAGVFTLEVIAAVAGAPPAQGTLPMVRALLDPAGPATVTWVAPRGFAVEVGAAAAAGPRPAVSGSVDVAEDDPPPAYRLVEAEEPAAPDADQATADPAGDGAPQPAVEERAGAEGEREPRVELAETHLAIDPRGRAWGVSRFDLVADDPMVRVRIPMGMRLFEVFVDGRIAADAVPSRRDPVDGDETWEVRLLDVRWPRSIVVVYAGEVEGGLPFGGTASIEGATVLGLPCRRRAWVIEAPEGLSLAPVAPARPIDADGLAAVRGLALDGMATAFASAIDAAPPGDDLRFESYFAKRRQEAALPLPAAWAHLGERRGERGPGWAAPVRVLEAGDVGSTRLTMAVSRGGDATAPGRLWATAAMLACFATLWEARRRTPGLVGRASALVSTWWALPAAAVVGGAAWGAMLDPAWPGWIAAAGGVAALATRATPTRRGFRREHGIADVPRGATSDTTRTAEPIRYGAAGASPNRSRQTGEDGATGSTIRRP